MPVVGSGQGSVVMLKVLNDFWEVPREGEDVGMLLLRKLHVHSYPLVLSLDVYLLRSFFLLYFQGACGEGTGGESGRGS